MIVLDRRAVLLVANIKLALQVFRQFAFIIENGSGYLEGRISPRRGTTSYLLRLMLPPGSPDVVPRLVIWDPVTLPKYGGETVNSLGCTHSFHTLPNGPGGRVTVCHEPGHWDAGKTYVQVLWKAQIWLECYQGHLATGNTISHYLG